MTATAISDNAAMTPMGEASGMPAQLSFPLAANAQVGKLQFVLIDPATGNCSLADDATPNQIMAGFGFPDELSATSPTAALAVARVSQRWAVHASPSTIANDGFTAADACTPFWVADGNTPGKLSNASGKNRSLGGLVVGLAQVGETAVRIWCGPIAQAVARAVLMADSKDGAWYQIADAAASTATTEIAMSREKMHGVVIGVDFTGDAVAADVTDYVTATVSKRDGAGGAATSMATYDSRAANNGAVTQHTPKAFTLSVVAGALNLLETDVVTLTVTKSGAGKALRGSIKLSQKVI